jgi:hypothetical protein
MDLSRSCVAGKFGCSAGPRSSRIRSPDGVINRRIPSNGRLRCTQRSPHRRCGARKIRCAPSPGHNCDARRFRELQRGLVTDEVDIRKITGLERNFKRNTTSAPQCCISWPSMSSRRPQAPATGTAICVEQPFAPSSGCCGSKSHPVVNVTSGVAPTPRKCRDK